MRTDNHLTESYWPADTTESLLHLTLGEVIRKNASEVPDRIALVDGVNDPKTRRRFTYRELLAIAEQTARALLARFKLGERIAICSPNCAEWIILQLGMNLAGLVLVPINPAYRVGEIEIILRNSEAVGIFYTPQFRNNSIAESVATLRARIPELREAHEIMELTSFIRSFDPNVALPKIDLGGLLQIQFTSGTVGVPKGACLHHQGALNTSRFVADRAGFPDGGVWLNAMPMFHVGGSVVCTMGAFAARGTLVIAPGFDPPLILELIESEKVNASLFVPTMIHALIAHPDFAKRDHSSMLSITTGASPVSRALVEKTKGAFGCNVVILFGQTEVNGVVSQTTPEDEIEDQTETVGRPLPQAEVRIVDPDGRTTPIGVEGELCVRGYQTMLRYCAAEDLTEATIDSDKWLHTGDLATMDSRGYLRISGRLKDMIIRGGMNLYPREIEDVLAKHEDVADVSVVGVPDEKWGELVAAVIRPANKERAPSPDALHAFCREHLAAHKAPVLWFFVDEYPMTPSGKIQKFMLQRAIVAGTIKPVTWSRTIMSEPEQK